MYFNSEELTFNSFVYFKRYFLKGYGKKEWLINNWE